MRLSVFFLLCLFVMACNKSEEDLCELGPALPILCIGVVDPVCGCDNVTYSNSCIAAISGVPSFTPGECP